jgi:hypothetical protein
MLRIVRNAGATVEHDGGASDAWLKLPSDSLASHLEAMVEQHAAELDYRLKVQAHRFNNILEALSEARGHVAVNVDSDSTGSGDGDS